MKTGFQEKGQVLIVIAIAAVALFAFAALAIDGSMVFSDRRQSQNASDTAVLAAALGKVQNETVNHPLYGSVNWRQLALERAAANGYDNNDPVTVVDIQLCSTDIVMDGHVFVCRGLPANANPNQYIHVVIKSEVEMTLAQILGWETMTNYTTAVSRATEPEPVSWYDGYGIAATHEGCWSNQNDVPFNLGGSGDTEIIGAGVLVSAVCPGSSTINVSGNPDLDTTTGICAPGEDVPNNDLGSLGSPGIQPSCNVPPPDYYTMPSEPICQNDGDIQEVSNGNWVATPGNFDDTFPDVQGGQANIKLTKGIYCLNDGLDLRAGWDITTDTNDDGDHDQTTEGVFFFIAGGDVQFNGNASAVLHAISYSTNSSFRPEWINLLMYIPPSNPADVHLTGGAGSTFTGTILAPAADVTIQGSSNSSGGNVTLDAQIIADIVNITGNADLTIVYNESNNAQTTTSPGISLIR